METVRIIVSGLIIVFSSWAVGAVFAYLRLGTCAVKEDVKILQPPRLIFWIGFAILLVIYVIIILIFTIAFTPENVACAVMLFSVSLIPLWLILYALNWRVELKENSFVFRNSFRHSREYRYSEITKIKRIKIGGFRVYIGKKSVAVDFYIKGVDNFWDIVKVLNVTQNK